MYVSPRIALAGTGQHLPKRVSCFNFRNVNRYDMEKKCHMHKCVWETLSWQRPMCFLPAGFVRPFNRQVDIAKLQEGSETMQGFQNSTSEFFRHSTLKSMLGNWSVLQLSWACESQGCLLKCRFPNLPLRTDVEIQTIWVEFRVWAMSNAPCLQTVLWESLTRGWCSGYFQSCARQRWLRNQVSQGQPQTCMNEWMREWINEIS